MGNYTFRLRSGHDLFDSIQSFVHKKKERDMKNWFITCRGGITPPLHSLMRSKILPDF